MTKHRPQLTSKWTPWPPTQLSYLTLGAPMRGHRGGILCPFMSGASERSKKASKCHRKAVQCTKKGESSHCLSNDPRKNGGRSALFFKGFVNLISGSVFQWGAFL